ncbi:MAG TPA: dihydrodipicolinate synthase family protein [Planctomycetota bacterium]|nr:dihydrodipicolinate synthase family protein [Planctomycetota bacterium]
MKDLSWSGVMPGITTPFTADGKADLDFLGCHAATLVDAGSSAIIGVGLRGEGATLRFDEKVMILRRLVESVGRRVPVIAAVSALSTGAAVELARAAASIGCRGLLVTPPYFHRGPWEEVEGHLDAVLSATPLPCMLHQHPAVYGVELPPDAIATLAARHANLGAVCDAGGDARRLTAVRMLCGDHLACVVGADDFVLEGAALGARGWSSGLVNALPRECVVLFDLARRGDAPRALELCRWLLPLLRLDGQPQSVQRLKLVQSEVGLGTERVRAPRLPLEGEAREETLRTVRERLAVRPAV